MRQVWYLVLSLLLFSVATSGVWAAEESANGQPAEAATKKTEPEKKAEPAKNTESGKKAKEVSKPAESKPVEKPAEKPVEKPAEKPETKPEESKPATHTVKAEALRIEVTLDGTFVAQTMTPIELRPESWSTFKVVKAVDHGERVRKGDVLVEFESDKIEEAIADRETARELAALSLKQAEIGLKLLETTTPIDLELADRQKRMMKEDLARFLKIDYDLSKKSAEFSLKSSEETLEYQMEELKQLEKMYEADDLTEETEEIILKRQRNAVERAKFYLEMAKNRFDETMNLSLPRSKESMQYSADLLDLSMDRIKATLPLDLEREKIGLEKLKIEQKRDAESFEKLKGDLKLMKLTAPVDGIVYYGKCVRGKWSGASTVADKLIPGATASTGVLMTIVSPRPLVIRASVEEKDLHWIKSGMRGTVTPTALPDARATATINEVESIPGVDGNFATEMRVSLTDQMDLLMPGMDCKVELVPYLKRNNADNSGKGHEDRRSGRYQALCLPCQRRRQIDQAAGDYWQEEGRYG